MREPKSGIEPHGPIADRWSTVRVERTVLGVMHNVASATRLLDLLRVFRGDTRVGTVFTCPGSSPFVAGMREFVSRHGLDFVPWNEAVARKFDLAIATSRGGELHKLKAPIIGAPHGMGYNKILRRETGAADRDTGAFGLTAEWLTHDGNLVPSAVVLSHEEQLQRLARGCPEAIPAAVVAGDPCLDELRAGVPFREEYRAAWNLLPGQRLVVISSTWSRESQLGKAWDVARHVMATLPRDEFRVAAVIHPNVWYAHSPWQLRTWLAPLQAAGLTLLRPEGDGWKAALLAADAVVGDYGSVTFYGAALGLPTLLADLPAEGTLAKDSPIAELLPLLGRVDTHGSLPAQINRAVDRHRADPGIAEVSAKATSVPGDSARILRALFYERMQLAEPAGPVLLEPVELPHRDAAFMVPRRSPVPAATVCAVTVDGAAVRLRRYPARLGTDADDHLARTHLIADASDPDKHTRQQADVLVARGLPDDATFAAVSLAHPRCSLVALPDGPGACVVATPAGRHARLTWESDDPRMSAWAAASAAHALLPDIASEMSVRMGDLEVPLRVELSAS